MTRVRVLVGGVVLVAAVSGCGVRSQSSPSAIETEDVPFGLLEPEAGTADPDQGGIASEQITVYLLGTDGLVPVERDVERPVGLRKVLRALVAGPTPEESAVGLQSALDPEASVPEIDHDGRRLLVELHESFFTEGGPPSGALAQIVYS
ncbi:MAG TPA: GerMN domain-containing protein, partial [Acidimicrobiia bacterium]